MRANEEIETRKGWATIKARHAFWKENTLTRALRSHQLWLTIAYLGLLVLMARGIAS